MGENDAGGLAFAPHNTPPRVIMLGASPRRDGNSRLLAEALSNEDIADLVAYYSGIKITVEAPD